MKVKPPDKLITVKCPFNTIIKKDEYKPILFDVCFRTHKLVIQVYQFIRLWILDKYHNKKEIPLISFDVLKMAFCALCSNDKGGNKPQGENAKLLEEFNTFYDKDYKKLNYKEKVNGSYLSQIINSMCVDMLTNIENNIKLNFIKYVNRFVNSTYRKLNNELVEKAEKGKKTELRKQLNKEIYEVKQDLINNTLLSNEKYHIWINKHRNNILPIDFVNSYEFDIMNNPQKYIKSMIYMCLQTEELGTKSFQFFPLRTDATVKYIPIDTKSIIEIFIKENKKELLDDIEGNKEKLWNMFFKLDNPVFKQSNYVFDYKIYTDCYAVSIQMLYSDNVDSEKLKKLNKKNKKKDNKEKTENMTKEQKAKFKLDEKIKQKKEQEQFKLKLKEQKDKYKAEFKKLPKEEKQKIMAQRKKEKEEDKIFNGLEFPYLEDLNETKLEELKKSNWVVADPGKKCLLYMKSNDGKTFRYTNRKHVNLTKRLKYQKLIKNYKDKNNISKIENKLSEYSSKTCKIKEFKNFIKYKNMINEKLFDKYNNEVFRKYKWYGFLNRRKTETKIIREIKKIFGRDTIVLHGDWGAKSAQKGNLSTPNIGLKRKLGNQITVYNLDEYKTSKLNYKTEEECDNLYLPDKNNVIRKIHSVLTYKMENAQIGCMNRDKNAVNNMIKIVKYYFEHKKRPEKYSRSDTIKDSNPKKPKKDIKKQGGSSSIKPV